MKADDNIDFSLEKIRNRDKNEFDRFFTAYFLRLAKFAYRYVANVAVARDLAQGVFVRIWELNGSWNPKGTIRSYLYVAVRNRCLNYLKKNKLKNSWNLLQDPSKTDTKIDLSWDDQKRKKMLEHSINRAVAKMPAKRREIFELSRYEGLTYKEIAEIKGITRKTVENQMGLALHFLRNELKDWIENM